MASKNGFIATLIAVIFVLASSMRSVPLVRTSRTALSPKGKTLSALSPLWGWTEHDGLLVEERKALDQDLEAWERIINENNIDGFRADYMKVNGKITDLGEAGIYGEIVSKGIRRLFDKIDLTEDDVLYDLGSGTGKVPIQFAVETPCKTNIGIELGETRHKASLRALESLKSSGKDDLVKAAEHCSFYKGNILADDPCWTYDATVLFICATAFPPALMNPLVAKIRTCKKLRCVMLFTGEDNGDPTLFDTEKRKWTFSEHLCESSWDDQNSCHLYLR